MRGYAVIHQEKKLKGEPVGGASVFNALANFAEEMKIGQELSWDRMNEEYSQWSEEQQLTEEMLQKKRILRFHDQIMVLEENDLEGANQVLRSYYPKAELVEIMLFGKKKGK